MRFNEINELKIIKDNYYNIKNVDEQLFIRI